MNNKKMRVTLLLWVGLIIFPIAEGLTNETVFGYDNFSIASFYVGNDSQDLKVNIYAPVINATIINSMYIEVYLMPFYHSGSQTCSVSGDGNVSFTINKPNGTYYNITFTDFVCNSEFRWVRNNISTTDFKYDGNYTIYFKALQNSGGWNSIGLDGITTTSMSYKDNSPYNINNEGNDSNYSWILLDMNLMLKIGINYSYFNPIIQNISINNTIPDMGSNLSIIVNTTSNVTSVRANDIFLINESNIWIGNITALKGLHTINITAMDIEGNTEWNNSTTYTGYDRILPNIVNVSLSNNTPVINTNLTVFLDVFDNDVVESVVMNGTSFIYIDDLWMGNITAQYGLKSLNISVLDISGNMNWSNVTYTGIDITSPVIHTVSINNTYPPINSTILITVNVSDDMDVIEVYADEILLSMQDNNIWNGTIIVIPGTHIINISVMDVANNIVYNNSTIYNTDNTTPTTTYLINGTNGNNEWNTSNVSVKLIAIDENTIDRTEYSFNNLTWYRYNSSFILSNEGITMVYYYSVDSSNNTESVKNMTIKIDKTPPNLIPPSDIQSTSENVNIGQATATDNIDTEINITNNAPNIFSIGVTIVTWQCVDDAGNTALANQTISILSMSTPTPTPAPILTPTSSYSTPTATPVYTPTPILNPTPITTISTTTPFPTPTSIIPTSTPTPTPILADTPTPTPFPTPTPTYIAISTPSIPFPTPIITPTPEIFLKGDVNDDGQVNIVDALFIAQYTVGLRIINIINNDVSGDGQVNIVDALFIAQATVGLREL